MTIVAHRSHPIAERGHPMVADRSHPMVADRSRPMVADRSHRMVADRSHRMVADRSRHPSRTGHPRLEPHANPSLQQER
jgi:hypothetical protein